MEYMPVSYPSHANSCIPTSIHSFAKTEETITSGVHSHALPEHNFGMYGVEGQASFMGHDSEGSAKSLTNERDQDAGKPWGIPAILLVDLFCRIGYLIRTN